MKAFLNFDFVSLQAKNRLPYLQTFPFSQIFPHLGLLHTYPQQVVLFWTEHANWRDYQVPQQSLAPVPLTKP